MFSIKAFAWDLGEAGTFNFEKINEQVYVMHGPLSMPNAKNLGFMNNPAIILAETGLIVIDPGSAYGVGKAVLKEIKKISDKPVLAVFNTHIHGDHWLANQAIIEQYPNARLYAHPEMIAQAQGEDGLFWVELMLQLTEGKTAGTKVIAPTLRVDQGQEIELAGQHFRIHSMLPSHTNTDIMIEHVESKTLFLGDNGFALRMGRFDDSSSMTGNIQALEYAVALKMKYYVPGHGLTGGSDTAVKPFLDYLLKVEKVVRAGLEDDLMDYQIKAKVINQFDDYKSWSGFEDSFGRHINKMFLELEEDVF